MATAPKQTPSTPALSPRRRRLFLALTLALPWLLLLLLELGLRLGGYGGDYPLFVPFARQPEYLVPNAEFARRYFPAGGFLPSPELSFFRAEKRPGAFRIVFQGESSAQGFPYGHGAAPARMLEQRLQSTWPGQEIEVVNTALTAISSYTLLDQADEIVGQRPDAVLIYTGHNEYYGALGAGSARSVGEWRPLVRAYLALRRLRTVQLLERALGGGGGATPSSDREGARTVMQVMAGEQRIPLGSRRYRIGLEQFRANLDALLARYAARGIPVLIGTVASNERDQPPFDGGPTSADSFYAAAKALDARGDSANARDAYRQAKERDALRFRAPEAINEIIREVAARRGATVVETQRALERASPGGVVGRTLMLEHLHPNVDGYFLIAGAFYEALRQKQMIGPWPAPVPAAQARLEVPVTPVDSAAALLRTDRLTSGWPFRPSGATRTPAVDTLRPRTPVEQIAQALVRGNIPWLEAMERQRAAFERAGDREGAVRVARAIAQEYRYAPEPLMDAARLSIEQRHYGDAARYARAAAERHETPKSLQLTGLLLLREGDRAAAMPYLERAARLAPGDQRIVLPLRAAGALPGLERRRASAPR
ncbi:MAG TPA: hypothetical protein VKA84_25925, partial [Gemmatimonadaceae bacterium]|nr:hypothetical protein [Gemmatimonadaceae bacterium]